MGERKVYLFSYSSALGTREQIKECLNRIPQIESWRTELPNAFFLISEESANKLADLIVKCRGGNDRNASILIAEIVNRNKQGYLTSESWRFINEKKS